MILPGWTREPLVHFLVAGAALFGLFAWQGEPADTASRTITITREDRARLAVEWERTMQRPPTDAELDDQVEHLLREEILYREALRLGLDRDDAVVRKRMANKMDFLAASMVESAPADDAVLRQWLARHRARFARDSSYSFDQRYFAQRGAANCASAEGMEHAGDAISLPASFENAPRNDVEARLGSAFMANLDRLAPDGKWAGPVQSGFGWHCVRLRQRTAGQTPPLAAIRSEVEADWRSETEAQRRKQAYSLLRSAYKVKIAR